MAYNSFGNNRRLVYCLQNDNNVYASVSLDDFNSELDRAINVYYYANTKKFVKKISIFIVHDVDPEYVDNNYIEKYRSNFTHNLVTLKKSKVKVLGNQKLAEETIFRNLIVKDIIHTRAVLLNKDKQTLKKILVQRKQNTKIPLTKKKMVSKIMKNTEINKILKRN